MTTTVCYCFGHTVESIGDEVARTGRSTVIARVTEKIRARECDCERLNPSGKCCLGEVRDAVFASLDAAGLPREAALTRPGDLPLHDCCRGNPIHVVSRDPSEMTA